MPPLQGPLPIIVELPDEEEHLQQKIQEQSEAEVFLLLSSLKQFNNDIASSSSISRGSKGLTKNNNKDNRRKTSRSNANASASDPKLKAQRQRQRDIRGAEDTNSIDRRRRRNKDTSRSSSSNSNRTSQDSRSPPPRTSSGSTSYKEQSTLQSKKRQAYYRMRDSFQTVLDYCCYFDDDGKEERDYDQSIIEEIRQSFFDYEDYVKAMEKLTKYATKQYFTSAMKATTTTKCCSAGEDDSSSSSSSSTDSMDMSSLLVTTWESMTNYLLLQCQEGHRRYFKLRQRADVTRYELELALRQKIELAEQCCAAQKGLLQVQAWQRRQSKRTRTVITACAA